MHLSIVIKPLLQAVSRHAPACRIFCVPVGTLHQKLQKPRVGARVTRYECDAPVCPYVKTGLNASNQRKRGCAYILGQTSAAGKHGIIRISKQLRRKRDSVVKPHAQGCFHTSAAGVRFFLSHCCLKGKRHL